MLISLGDKLNGAGSYNAMREAGRALSRKEKQESKRLMANHLLPLRHRIVRAEDLGSRHISMAACDVERTRLTLLQLFRADFVLLPDVDF